MNKKYLQYLLLTLIAILIILWVVDISNQEVEKSKNYQILEDNRREIIAVFKVIDGDSLRMKNGEEVRLLEIDAPEYKQTCFNKNKKQYDCGEVSTKFLRKLVKNVKLTCKYRKKDIYNRYLATCFDGNKNINYEMVRNGMAIIYNIHQASDEVKYLEKQARNNKIGLWQGRFLVPKEFRKMKIK